MQFKVFTIPVGDSGSARQILFTSPALVGLAG